MELLDVHVHGDGPVIECDGAYDLCISEVNVIEVGGDIWILE